MQRKHTNSHCRNYQVEKRPLELNEIADYAHGLMKEMSWDIFCKVVDNFGDIGVCWRLAKQLHHEHNINIRLFVDKLEVARHILVGLENVEIQDYDGVQVVRWHDALQFPTPAHVVIETFACGLPEAYLSLMHHDTVWVNLDYLSAESWVEGFHGLHGQHPETHFKRHFYFPGFLETTGGLFREQTLVDHRDAFQQSDGDKRQLWQQFGVDDAQLTVSLFSYVNAPIEPLLQTVADHGPETAVLMPHHSHMPESLMGNQDLIAGDVLKVGHLSLYILPFLSQTEYDKLLWACDINVVRGEDSWLRALWAGKPFVWQPYRQIDDAHLVKLNAFIDTLYQDAPVKKAVSRLHRDWSTGQFSNDVWQSYLTAIDAVQDIISIRVAELAKQETLASKLVAFCEKLTK